MSIKKNERKNELRNLNLKNILYNLIKQKNKGQKMKAILLMILGFVAGSVATFFWIVYYAAEKFANTF